MSQLTIPQVNVRVTGTTMLLMHSDRGVDPLSPGSKELRAYTSKKKKTDDDHEAVADIEMRLGLWLNDDGRVIIPSTAIAKCLNEAGKLTKEGMKVLRGIVVLGDALLEYSGPKDVDALVADRRFRDRRSVCVNMGKSRVMRTRPKFQQWGAVFSMMVDVGQCDIETCERLWESAGRYIGIGNYRTMKGGTFGRFSVEVLK